MNDASVREHVDRHAGALVRGDMDAVMADFSEDLRSRVPALAQALPQPVTSAEVLRIHVAEPESEATIRYSGESSAVTIVSRWRDVDRSPVIVHA